MDRKTTGRLFPASKYAEAVAHKEQTGGIMKRWQHVTMGVVYEVSYLPTPEPVDPPRELTKQDVVDLFSLIVKLEKFEADLADEDEEEDEI